MDADEAWQGLDRPWRAALDEAWAAWRDGNLGIGAVLVDPSAVDADGSPRVVAQGRNRVNEQRDEPGVLANNFMAHAEMNAFAALDAFTARGLHLYTTLEPCLMCAATAIFMRVDHVHFAACDEFFDDIDDLWSKHPYTAERRPDRSGPLPGKVGRFSRLLPLTFMLKHQGDRAAAVKARRDHPDLCALAEHINATGRLDQNLGQSVSAALRELWRDLPG